SGGPWFSSFDTETGLGTISSVISFTYADDSPLQYGPRLGDQARRMFDDAELLRPPLKTPMDEGRTGTTATPAAKGMVIHRGTDGEPQGQLGKHLSREPRFTGRRTHSPSGTVVGRGTGTSARPRSTADGSPEGVALP